MTHYEGAWPHWLYKDKSHSTLVLHGKGAADCEKGSKGNGKEVVHLSSLFSLGSTAQDLVLGSFLESSSELLPSGLAGQVPQT